MKAWAVMEASPQFQGQSMQEAHVHEEEKAQEDAHRLREQYLQQIKFEQQAQVASMQQTLWLLIRKWGSNNWNLNESGRICSWLRRSKPK